MGRVSRLLMTPPILTARDRGRPNIATDATAGGCGVRVLTYALMSIETKFELDFLSTASKP
jgi:hypothetical protein